MKNLEEEESATGSCTHDVRHIALPTVRVDFPTQARDEIGVIEVTELAMAQEFERRVRSDRRQLLLTRWEEGEPIGRHPGNFPTGDSNSNIPHVVEPISNVDRLDPRCRAIFLNEPDPPRPETRLGAREDEALGRGI